MRLDSVPVGAVKYDRGLAQVRRGKFMFDSTGLIEWYNGVINQEEKNRMRFEVSA